MKNNNNNNNNKQFFILGAIITYTECSNNNKGNLSIFPPTPRHKDEYHDE